MMTSSTRFVASKLRPSPATSRSACCSTRYAHRGPGEAELSIVVEHNSEICAHVLFTRAIVDAPGELVDVLVLSPVGVRPDLQHQGIGTAMITQALRQTVESRPEPAIFLEGNPFFYSRFGFESACSISFRRPSLRIPEPAFQVFRLPAFDSSLSGTLVYPDAFWRTDSVGLR